MKKIYLVLLALPLLAACAGGGSGTGTSAALTEAELMGQHYVLESVNGESFNSTFRTPELQFDGKMRISGRVCNSFSGPASLKDGVITAPQLASTLMLCPDAKLNKLEQDFYGLLRQGAGASLENGKLTLRGEGTVLQFKKAEK